MTLQSFERNRTMNGVIADTHWSSSLLESESLFPKKMSTLPRAQAESLYGELVSGISRSFSLTLESMRREAGGKMGVLVNVGDATSGWQEQGDIHSSVLTELKRGQMSLGFAADKVLYCAGNHDTGYLGPTPHSGINIHALKNWEEIVGDLWWQREVDGVIWLGICSPLAEYFGDHPEITELRANQKEFVATVLGDSPEKRWVFYTHSPLVGRFLADELLPHLDRLDVMIFGDYHDQRKAGFIKAYARALGFTNQEHWVNARLCRQGVCAPAVAPLWCPGGGYLLFEGSPTKDKVQTYYSSDAQIFNKDLPTSSFLKALWWRSRLAPNADLK